MFHDDYQFLQILTTNQTRAVSCAETRTDLSLYLHLYSKRQATLHFQQFYAFVPETTWRNSIKFDFQSYTKNIRPELIHLQL